MIIATDLQSRIRRYFNEKLAAGGAAPAGVDFNSEYAQQERFRQLLRVIDMPAPFSLTDYGCGYGALFAYLTERYRDFSYQGFDITDSMINAARTAFSTDQRAQFQTERSDVEEASYVVASGLFNIPFLDDRTDWQRYIEKTLDDMASLATRGFAFNMLTTYSDADKMRASLYYGDPHYFFSYCRKYSRHIALLHDYELYDFTVVVRKTLS